jgi:kumamolisin
MIPRLLGYLTLGALLAVTTSTAAAGATKDTGATRVLRGTALPVLRHATLLRATPDTAPVDVVVSLKPRNPELLAQMAAASSGRPALSAAQIRRWFLPAPSTVGQVSRYMHASGFRLTASHGLSLSFHGDAGAAGRAFSVRLGTYRNTLSGRAFRAPDAAVQLPAGIASQVRSVSGLDSALTLTHQSSIAVPAPQAVSPQPGCNGPAAAKAANGGYLPADLATAYGHQTLLDATPTAYDGTGQGIGLLEFSGYKPTDISAFRGCFGLSHTTIHNIKVNGGPADHNGAAEVELDMEVALAHAPGLDNLYVYMAPNNISQFIAMVNRMSADSQTTGLSIVSDSWGMCELALPVSTAQAESEALQLAAVNGLSFYVASGDDGSSGCHSMFGYDGLVADDPAAQPFATGVGGTTLGSGTETAWTRGGGGVSMNWPMPAYQQPVGMAMPSPENGAKCGNNPPTGQCRQVPDVALNADPATGYIIKCTDVGCPRSTPWFQIGGTSAAAPLMAAITADANEYSNANGGTNLGFANPCLYAAAGTSVFSDITTGGNDWLMPGSYRAGVGYDLATGLGSPEANAFAAMVQACTTHGPSTESASVLTAAPGVDKAITYGTTVTLHGNLTTGGAPLANRAVYIEMHQGRSFALYTVMTDGLGNWSRSFAKTLTRNTRWQVFFPGSDTEKPAKSPAHFVFIKPALTNTLSTHAIRAGQTVTVSGGSRPNMSGQVVALQVQKAPSRVWHTVGRVRVAANARYGGVLRMGTPGTYHLRWVYVGGRTSAFLTAISDVEPLSVR